MNNTLTTQPRLERAPKTAPLTALEAAQRQLLLTKFRSKLTPHVASIVKTSEPVRKQFVPDLRELEEFGTEKPFEEGKDNRGIYGLERIYEDRAVLTPYFECAAYCRYCFKKTRTLAGEAKRMSEENIVQAIRYISQDSRIKTVLITGGDPFMDPALLKRVLDDVIQIPHITNIRVGTRNILFRPQAITDEFAEMLSSYNRIEYGDIRRSKSLTVGLSINHADELTPEVVKAARRLIERGVTVRGQVVLMKDINDNTKTMSDLVSCFLAVGIVPYYLFHCMPVVGAKHFRTTVQKGLDILREMSPYSGTTAMHYVYVTPLGKHRISPGHRLQYVMLGNERYIRAVTPYRARDFLEFSDKKTLPPLHQINDEGFVISHYLDGDTE